MRCNRRISLQPIHPRHYNSMTFPPFVSALGICNLDAQRREAAVNRSPICLVGIPLILCALAADSLGAGQPITSSGYLPLYVVSPDQSRLIYQNGDGLYSARTDGVGAPVRI